MNEKTTVVFVEAWCSSKKQLFYMRYDLDASNEWVLTKGIINKPNDSSHSSYDDSKSNVNVAGARKGPLYSCPYCGATGSVRCGTCLEMSCWIGEDNEFYCGKPGCNHHGKVGGSLKTLNGSKGTGQG